MPRRLFEALLRVGEVNANELERVLDGEPSREHPPGLKEAYAELEAARKAAGSPWDNVT